MLSIPRDRLHFSCSLSELKAPPPALGSRVLPVLTTYIQPAALSYLSYWCSDPLISSWPHSSAPTRPDFSRCPWVDFLPPTSRLAISHSPNCSWNGVSKGSNLLAPSLLLQIYLSWKKKKKKKLDKYLLPELPYQILSSLFFKGALGWHYPGLLASVLRLKELEEPPPVDQWPRLSAPVSMIHSPSFIKRWPFHLESDCWLHRGACQSYRNKLALVPMMLQLLLCRIISHCSKSVVTLTLATETLF